MNYELSVHYGIKIPNIADTTTVNVWGEIVNDAMQKIDDVIVDTDIVLDATDTLVGYVTTIKNNIVGDASGVETQETLLVNDLNAIEAKSPVSSETQATLEADISEMETKLYTTIPTLKAAATNTGGFTGSADFSKTFTVGDRWTVSHGSVISIATNIPMSPP